MSKVPSEVFSTKTDWLNARKAFLMASDSRAILGQGYSNESRMGVFQDKISPEIPPEIENESFDVGLLLEPVMAELLEKREGIKCKADRDFRIRRSSDFPWMGATLDRWYYDEEKHLIPVEFKALGLFAEWHEGEVPIKVQIQVQHQMCVCAAPYAWVVGFGGINRVHCHRIERDDRFITGLVLALTEFRWHVQKRIPPDPDGSMSTAKAILALHPDDDGLGVDLPPEGAKVAAQLRSIKDAIKQLDVEKIRCENWLKHHIGPHTIGVIPGGSGFSWKTQEKKEYTVAASKTRVLREIKSVPKGIEFVPYTPPKIEDHSHGDSQSASSEEGRTEEGREGTDVQAAG